MCRRHGLQSWQLISGLLLLSVASGCRPTTEIVLGLATNLSVPDELDRIDLRITRGGEQIINRSWQLPRFGSQGIDLPISYALYTNGNTPMVDITLAGFHEQQELVRRSSTVKFIRGKTLFLRLALVEQCVAQQDCPVGRTCIEGRCGLAEVQSEFLPEYRTGLEGQVTCSSGTRLVDTRTGLPLPLPPDEGRCPEGQRCVEGTCYRQGAPPCTIGLTACDNLCVDLQSDSLHCGLCDKACSGDSLCFRGQCSATSCLSLHEADPSRVSGIYSIDPDGPTGLPTFLVYCDMTTAGGGWTLIEKIPFNTQRIDRALFADAPANEGFPEAPRHRLSRRRMAAIQNISTDMRIDCRGNDYLLTTASNLFRGEDYPYLNCSNAAPALYKEASLLGRRLNDVRLCTWFVGPGDGDGTLFKEGCEGAFHIDEHSQGIPQCSLPNYPWTGGQMPITPDNADAFSPSTPNRIPEHDCHQTDASRYVMLR